MVVVPDEPVVACAAVVVCRGAHVLEPLDAPPGPVTEVVSEPILIYTPLKVLVLNKNLNLEPKPSREKSLFLIRKEKSVYLVIIINSLLINKPWL